MEEQQVKQTGGSINKFIEKHNKEAQQFQQSIKKISLNFFNTFGMCQENISNQMIMVDNNTIIFFVGVSIIVKDLQMKTCQFLTREGGLRNITAIQAVRTQKGLIVAVGESTDHTDNPVQISIYIKNKWQTLTDGQLRGQVRQIQLNENSNYCVSKIESGVLTFIDFWNYKNEKLLAQYQTRNHLGKFLINPKITKNLVLSGNQYLRNWELLFQARQLKEVNQQLIPLKIEKENRFLDMCWVMLQIPILVVLAPGNKVFLIQNDSLKKTIQLEFLTSNLYHVEIKELIAENVDEYQGLNNMLDNIVATRPKPENNIQQELAKQNLKNVHFSCLTQTKKGFIIGGEQGYISYFEIISGMTTTNTLNFQVKFPDQNKTIIQQISSAANDSLLTIISNQDKEYNYSILNSFQLDSDKLPIEPFFPSGFHKKKIITLTSSTVKSIFASCSLDKKVKFWTYQDEMKGLFSIDFENEPNCISLHPTGLFISIAFQMTLKVYAILNQSLMQLKELVLGSCTLTKYSQKGHYLVANENQIIHIFEAINYNLLVSLEKHVSLIKSIYISDDDFFMVSQCINGYLNVWDVQREIEKYKAKQNYQYISSVQSIQQVQQSINMQVFNCYCFQQFQKSKEKKDDKEQKEITNIFVAAGTDRYLSVYKNKLEELVAEFISPDQTYIYSMIISKTLKILICGTNKGTIRIYPWPFIEELFEMVPIDNKQVRFKIPDCYEIQVHSSTVSSLVISHDNQYLIAGFDDGSITALKINIRYDESESIQAQKIEERIKMTGLINDMMFIHQSRITEMNENIKKLNFEVVKSEQTVMIETQKIHLNHQQKLQKIQQNIDQLTKEFQDQEKEMEERFTNQYQELSDHFANDQQNYDTQINQLQIENKRQIEYETQRNLELEQEINQMQLQHQEFFKNQLEQHKKDLKNLRLSYQRKCEQIQVKYTNVVNNAKNFGTAFIQRLDKQEQEYNRELEDQVFQLKEEIKVINEINKELAKQNQKLQEEFDKLKLKDEQLKADYDDSMKKHTEFEQLTLKNDAAMVKQQHQLLERVQVIESKDETCRMERDEQINLENFRYLLDQKIKMLQNEKTQILDKLKEKEANLTQMFQELIKETDKNDKKYIQYKQVNREKEVQFKQLNQIKDVNRGMKGVLAQFQSSILQIMKTPDQIAPTSKKLYDMIEYDYQSTQQPSVRSNIELEGEDINSELEKQGRWMNRKLWLIDETNKKLKEIREENVDQILNQNTKLIEECNIIRAENERYKKLTRNVQKMLLEAKRMKTKRIKKPNIQKLVKKYEDNTIQLKNQSTQLNNLQQSINELLKTDSDDLGDSTKFPSINKQKQQNQSLTLNQSKEPEKKLPILIEESV